ncbi:MAG: hypothetical protein V3T30_07950 [Thermodesulfobacteriota bacterium]
MAGSPKSSKLSLLILIVVLILLSSFLATLAYKKGGSDGKVTDTAAREKLLARKNLAASFAGYEPTDSRTFSNIIFDLQVEPGRFVTLPWANSVARDPGGGGATPLRGASRCLFPQLFRLISL